MQSRESLKFGAHLLNAGRGGRVIESPDRDEAGASLAKIGSHDGGHRREGMPADVSFRTRPRCSMPILFPLELYVLKFDIFSHWKLRTNCQRRSRRHFYYAFQVYMFGGISAKPLCSSATVGSTALGDTAGGANTEDCMGGDSFRWVLALLLNGTSIQ